MTKQASWIVAAGIAISAGAASAQGLPRAGYGIASDFDAPYATLPPERPLQPPRIYGPRYGERTYDEPGYAPAILPPTAVYGMLRDRGYSPLGVPQQRGFVYTISVISPEGDDGRLVIDARSGRILRFLPAYRMGDRMNNEITVSYGPVAAPPPISALGGMLRPPALVPRVVARTSNVPLPKPTPVRAVASKTASQPADAQASIQKPSGPVILPTQEMSPVQGFE